MRNSSFNRRFDVAGILFIIIPVVLTLFLIIYPLTQSIFYSFTDFDGFRTPVIVGLENYVNLFRSDVFYTSFKNNFIIALASPLFIFIPLILAILFFQTKGKFLKSARMLIFLPFAVSMTVVGVIFRSFFQYRGPINEIIRYIGMEFLVNDWLVDKRFVFPLIILAVFWRSFGIYTVIYLSALSNVDRDVLDAAKVDGTNWWQQFIHVIIPQINPIIVFVTALVLIADFRGMFDYVYNISRGGPGYYTHTIEFLLYREGFTYMNMGYACAIGIIIFITIFVFTYFQIKVTTRES